jgi:uncharacterized protein (DUF1015 family)
MAILKPFKAWRPKPELINEIACVPYDVISTDEARVLAGGRQHSFLHVIRPEIDFDPDTDIYDARVYEKGKANLEALFDSGAMIRDSGESLYVYRLEWKDTIQTGIFGCVSVHDYDNEVIVKHELTRPPKENDRTKHILTQQAHAEPVMMTFESNEQINSLISQTVTTSPLYEFEAEDSVKHTIWKIDDSRSIINAFGNIPTIYIADGHHRCASASRAAHEMASQHPDSSPEDEYWYFPAVLFPKSEMTILSYNRIIKSVPDQFFRQFTDKLSLTPSDKRIPSQKGEVTCYFDGKWWSFKLPESDNNAVSDQLDVARLQEFVLQPMLGITDQRTDPDIDFIGGSRGTKELEQLVDSGDAALAFYLYPTSVDELIAVSDARQLMPPKSTWFEPKLRSGILIHTFT